MTSVTAQSHVWMMVVMVSGLASSFLFALSQWFPNFFWSRTNCGSYGVSTYHLVPGSVNGQNIVWSKVWKLFQHEQNGCKNFLLPFSKPTREVHKNSGIYLQNPISKNCSCEYNFCLEKVGLFVHHVESLHVGLPLVVRVPQFGNHCIKIKWAAG